MTMDATISGQLIRNFNWGPAQPSGGPQHCMYVVGGILGYQWADFHCDFEMNFLCEYQASDCDKVTPDSHVIPLSWCSYPCSLTITPYVFVASKVNRQIAWKKRRRKKSMQFDVSHSNSTSEDKCGGQLQPEKLDSDSDPWENREDEEEFSAF